MRQDLEHKSYLIRDQGWTMMKFWTVLTCFIGLCIGNFVFQAMNQELWAVATERSFFQGTALLLAWCLEHTEINFR